MAAKKTKAKKAQPKKKVAKKAPAKKKPAPATKALAVVGTQELATRDEAIRALMHSMNSEDRRVIVHADEAPNPYMLRCPTGTIELDIDLGGGFPCGGCSIISGPDNAGKTYLVLKTMAMQQRLHGHACRLGFGLAEGAFPFDQAINAGLKIAVPDEILEEWQEWRRRRGMPLYTLDELQFFKQKVGEFYILRGATGEEILQTKLECIRTKAFNMIATDSLQGLQPSVDADKDIEDFEMRAAHATMIGKFFKKYIPLTTGLEGLNRTCVIFTQQVRANQERANAPSNMQKYIKDWAVTGSRAAKHYKLIDLVIWNGGVLKKGEGKARHAIGKEMKWLLDKGKAGTHDNKSGEVSFYYEKNGIDDVGELMTSGIKRGVIQTRQVTKSRKEIVVARPDTGEILEDFTAPTQRAMRAMITADFDYELALRREILTAAGIECLYR